MSRIIPSLLLLTAFAAASTAQPVLQLQPPPCVPAEGNTLVELRSSADEGVREIRAYFRWDERANFYYVVMAADGPGASWAVLPKPEERNESVEIYATAHNAGGDVVARSTTIEVEVDADCRTELDERQRGYADNLVIGETAASQFGDTVLGFLCDGIVSRIGPDGVLRADETCRACVIGAVPVQPPPGTSLEALAATSVLFGAGVVTTVIVVDGGTPPERSPSRP